jgi:hypothetical protein
MQRILFLSLAIAFITSCGESPAVEPENDPADELFKKAFQLTLKDQGPRGIMVDSWFQYGSMQYEVPECDSAYYFVAIEEKLNEPRNRSIFQKIMYLDGDFKTEERIEYYQKRTAEGQTSYQVKDLRSNILIFFQEGKNALRADKTGAILEKIERNDPELPLLRREAGLMLPGRTFHRCRDNNIMAFFNNEELVRLGQFMEVYVGKNKTGSVLFEGLYTKPDYGEPEIIMITEIKMTNPRSSCP